MHQTYNRRVIELTEMLDWIDAEGVYVEIDSQGIMYSTCSRCGEVEIASPCAYDHVDRICNACFEQPVSDVVGELNAEELSILLGD